jgi:hypothetical protein
VGSIPSFGPNAVEGVPSASIFKSANPIAIVDSNLEASLLYILLTAFQVDRKAASIVFFLIDLFIKTNLIKNIMHA